jgi:hypothetical protein
MEPIAAEAIAALYATLFGGEMFWCYIIRRGCVIDREGSQLCYTVLQQFRTFCGRYQTRSGLPEVIIWMEEIPDVIYGIEFNQYDI